MFVIATVCIKNSIVEYPPKPSGKASLKLQWVRVTVTQIFQ